MKRVVLFEKRSTVCVLDEKFVLGHAQKSSKIVGFARMIGVSLCKLMMLIGIEY
jgi:hypothetical protein